MFPSRSSYGIWLVALTLALAGVSWAQTTKTVSPDHAIMYRQAVLLLDQAQEKLTAGNTAAAMSLVKESKSIFALLEKEYASLLAERRLTPKEDQQLAINQKLASDLQIQVDRLMESAAAKEKAGRQLEAQGQGEMSTPFYQKSKDEYLQAQNLSLKAAIYALRNQEIIFRGITP